MQQTIRQSIAPVYALLLSVAILLAGNGLLGTLIPVRANLEKFSSIDIGILGSCYFVGFTLGCLAAPALIARAGHIRSYLAFVSVASTVALLHAIFVDPWIWWLLRAMTGFCFSVLFVIIESWLNERSTNETRGTIFSIYMVINLTVLTLGQLMLTVSDPKLYILFSLAAILLSQAALPIAMTRAHSPEPIPKMRPRLAKLYKQSPVGFMGCFAVGLANGAFWSLGPVFAMDRGLDTTGIAFFMSAAVIGGAIGQWPLGRVSDKLDRRIVILSGCLLAGLAGLLLTLFGANGQTAVFSLAFSFGMFAIPLYALSVAHANDYTEPSGYVETSSGLLLVYGIGSVIGPTLSSLLDTFAARNVLFTYTAIVHVLIAAFVIWRISRRAPVEDNEKIDFHDALVAAQVVAPIEGIKAAEETESDDAAGAGANPLPAEAAPAQPK